MRKAARGFAAPKTALKLCRGCGRAFPIRPATAMAPGGERRTHVESYLVGYNLYLTCLWGYAFFTAAIAAARGGLESAFPAAALPTAAAQVVALMEPLHAIFGIVHSSPSTAFLQWSGRANVLFPAVMSLPEVRSMSFRLFPLASIHLPSRPNPLLPLVAYGSCIGRGRRGRWCWHGG